MIVKLLTEHHLDFLSEKEAAQALLSLHLSKCHIVENLMSRLILYFHTYFFLDPSSVGHQANTSQALFPGYLFDSMHSPVINPALKRCILETP